MRYLYVVLFLLAFWAALMYFKHGGESSDRLDQPVQAHVELHIPTMT